jgi:protein phosphatase
MVMVRPRFNVQAAGRTDTGVGRAHNEDAWIVDPAARLYAVADGVSLAPSGEVASERTLTHIHDLVAYPTWPTTPEGVSALFIDAVRSANTRLNARQPRAGLTTFAGFLVEGEHACIAHVGDSRVYRLRDGELQRLTEDHTLASDFIARGRPAEEANAMPNATTLSRALGSTAAVDVTARVEELRVGDVFLVCTDGLSGVVPEEDIADVLASIVNTEAAAELLIARANELGGRDNMTTVVVRAERFT